MTDQQDADIKSIKARLAMVFNGDYVFEHDDAMSAMDKLLSALDKAQREIHQLKDSGQKIDDELVRAEREIARLSSPPEERGEIVEKVGRMKLFFEDLVRGSPYRNEIWSLFDSIDTLLQDLRRYSNAHKILLAERDEARGKVEWLEALLDRFDKWMYARPQFHHGELQNIWQESRGLGAADGQQESPCKSGWAERCAQYPKCACGTGDGVEGE